MCSDPHEKDYSDGWGVRGRADRKEATITRAMLEAGHWALIVSGYGNEFEPVNPEYCVSQVYLATLAVQVHPEASQDYQSLLMYSESVLI